MSVRVEIDAARPDMIAVYAEWRHKELTKALPGSSWDKNDNVWRVPLSWTSCLALRGTFRDELEIGPKLGEWAMARRSVVDNLMILREALDHSGAADLYPFQRAGVEFMAQGRRVLLADEMGCLTGDTEIIVNRGGKATRMSLETLYSKWTLPAHKRYSWARRPDVQTRVKSLGPDGVLRLNDVVNVIDKGVKPVLTMTLKSGRSVTCTYDHEICTGTFDGWMPAEKLSVGDMVAINGTPTCKRCGDTENVIGEGYKFAGYCKTCMYRYMRRDKWGSTGRYHPDPEGYVSLTKQWDAVNARPKKGRVFEHVLVMANHLGRPIREDEHVHHKNGDKTDNRLENLELLSASDHHKIHAAQDQTFTHFDGGSGRRGEIWFLPKLDEIISIEPAGEQRVYDLVMADPARNFVANGIVVHNSGKTVQAIRALAELYARGDNVFPILVVCPNSMKKTWQREFAKWWPGVESSIVAGSATQRRKALAVPAHVYIINWESLRAHSRLAPYGSIALARCSDCGGYDERITATRCEVHPRELNDMQFGAIIADEVHRSKSPSAKQTRALWAASGDTPIRFALSGTPIANDVTELWSTLHWLDPREYPTKTKWVDRYVDTMLNAFGGLMVLGVKRHMSDEFYAGLHPHFRRMPKELVLPFLPPIVYERRDVEMSAKQRKAYVQMRDELVAELDGELLTVTSPLTKATRLLQFASSYATMEISGEFDEVVKVVLTEPSCKIDEFIDDLPDFGDEGVAVMAVSRQLINLLSARLEKLKIPHGLITGEITQDQRQRHIDDFQAGRTKFILFTAAAGGVGITLTAARYLVRLQRPWSRVDDEQALNRVHRIGSERHESIIVVDYITENTLESRVLDRLAEKGEYFEDVVKDHDLLRRLLTGGED